MFRLLKTQPAAIGSAAAAVYAAAAMIYRAFIAQDMAVLDEDVLVAGAAALYSLYVWFRVTPTADPKDSQGRPLVPLGEVPPAR